MEKNSRIVIRRNSKWADKLRSYTVFIDEIDCGSIKNNSSEEFLVAPGEHKIQCKIDWCYSPVFNVNIKENEIIYLRAKNTIGLFFPIIALLFWILILVANIFRSDLQQRSSRWFMFIVFFLLLLYQVYCLTIGRKKYLKLEEDKKNIFTN